MEVAEAGEVRLVLGLRLEVARWHFSLALPDHAESIPQQFPFLSPQPLLPLWAHQPSLLEEVSDPLGNDLAFGAEGQRGR